MEFTYDSATGQEHATQPHQHSNKKRRSSKSKVPGVPPKSSSTPHKVRSAPGNPSDLSRTSKKPDIKLDYTRTNGACGYCRRKKRRCVVAPDAPAGCCSNCIRMGNECKFPPDRHKPDVPQAQTMSSKSHSAIQPAKTVSTFPRYALPSSDDAMGGLCTQFYTSASSGQPPSFGNRGDDESDVSATDDRTLDAASTLQLLRNTFTAKPPPNFYPPPIGTRLPSKDSVLPAFPAGESPTCRNPPSTANSAYGSESNGADGQHTPAKKRTSSTESYNHQDAQWCYQLSLEPPSRSMSYDNIEGLPQQCPGLGLEIQHAEYQKTSPYP